jgi:branched-chain amino acid transport system permease protein
VNLGMFVTGILILVGIYAIQSLSLGVKFGTLGLIDLGLVGYFAVGAYAFTLVTAPPPGAADSYYIGLGWPLWAGFIIAPLVTCAVSLLVALPALRLKGEYLAIATYAFAEVIRAIFTNERWLTNGVVGFQNLRQPWRDVFSTGNSYQYFFMILVFAVVLVLYLILRRFSHSPFGRSLRAIRENEPVAMSVGKNVTRMKVKAFGLGGLIAGIAACFYVSYFSLIVPSMFVPEMTWTVWIAVTIGGVGNYLGAIIGTLVLVSAQEATRLIQASAEMAPRLSAIRLALMGLILILIIRFKPRGILPERPWIDRSPVPAPASPVASGAVAQAPATDQTTV